MFEQAFKNIDDVLDFANRQLFPYLQGFKAKASGPNTIEYKIGEIFSEIKNRIQWWIPGSEEESKTARERRVGSFARLLII
jgi:hypothetical protein